jgi:hypothetical protein
MSIEATKDQHCEIGPMLISPEEAKQLTEDVRAMLAVCAIQDHSEFSRSLLSNDLVDGFFDLFV